MSLLEPKGESTRMGTELIKVSKPATFYKAQNITCNHWHDVFLHVLLCRSKLTEWAAMFLWTGCKKLYFVPAAPNAAPKTTDVRCKSFSDGPILSWTILYVLSDKVFFTHQVSVYTQTPFKWYCNTCEHLDFMKVLQPNDFMKFFINFSGFHSWNHVANRRWHLVPPAFLAQRWRWDLGLSQPQQCSRPIGAASLFLKDFVDFLEVQIQSYRWMKLM